MAGMDRAPVDLGLDDAAPAQDSAGAGVQVGPLVYLAGAWMAGLTLAGWWPWIWLWFILAMLGLGMTSLMLARALGWGTLRRRSSRPTSTPSPGPLQAALMWALIAACPLAGVWGTLSNRHIGRHHVSAYLRDEAQLVQVTGTLDGATQIASPQRGAFAHFSYEPPSTYGVLKLESLLLEGQEQPVTGRLLVRIPQADHRLSAGMNVRMLGWLSQVQAPRNPGESDYRVTYAQRELDGNLTLDSRANVTQLAPPAPTQAWSSWREQLAQRASESLRLGLSPQPERLAFLDAILLGRWGPDLTELRESFRRTGLSHLLSISGAHLGILLGMVWWLSRLCLASPPRAAMVVLIVLGMYMLALPMQVAIVRAGIMAGLLCLAMMTGRQVGGLNLIALAAVLVLIWRPGDLFLPGFQLSYGVTAALLLFTRPVSRMVFPPPMDGPAGESRLRRFIADILAVNLVGFAVSLPLVAYHFGLVSPLAVALSVLALLPVSLTLGLGYVKIMAGLVLPSVGMVLAGPLEWSADSLTMLTRYGGAWRGATVELPESPGVLWTVATLAVVLAVFFGAFGRRIWQGAAAVLVCIIWLGVSAGWAMPVPRPALFQATPTISTAPLPHVVLNSFYVGDGSCYLLRIWDTPPPSPATPPSHTLMFDCGSQNYLDVGLTSILPALRHLGLHRIDTLVVSHADLDHFCGVLDVADGVPVTRVLVSAPMRELALAEPASTSGYLCAQLLRRGIPVHRAMQGWEENLAGVDARMLWPAAEVPRTLAHNDLSLVLRVTVPGPVPRRLLMTGDIQNRAIEALLSNAGPLRADVTDLPHHGSFVTRSADLIQAVSPSDVLQSCGPRRLRIDPWPGTLGPMGISRHITHRAGMIELTIDWQGQMHWKHFRNAEEPTAQ